LELEGSIGSEWCDPENYGRPLINRPTCPDSKSLQAEKHNCEPAAVIIARLFELKAQDLA
jgi:hypothetical protein